LLTVDRSRIYPYSKFPLQDDDETTQNDSALATARAINDRASKESVFARLSQRAHTSGGTRPRGQHLRKNLTQDLREMQ